jgi:hypothetical protein
MRSFIFSFVIFMFVIIAAGAAPAAHAQLRANVCYNTIGGDDCPPGQRCDISTNTCVSSGGTYTQPGGNTGGTYTQPGGNTGSNVTLINPLNSGDCTPNGDCLRSFLMSILDFVIQIGGIAVVLMLVYVGYMFVIAQGNETKITDARKALLWTVIGAMILLGSKAISLGIEQTVRALGS